MRYDFDSVTDRRQTAALKWDIGENELPMWVADMDFQTAPEVIEAMRKRLEHGVFGYSVIPEKWYLSYQNWWKNRHHFKIEKDWLVFCTGVVPALSSCVRKLTTPGENVLVQTPVYNIFFNSIRNNGRNILTNPLLLKDGNYEMDFEDLEKKLSDPQTTLMILCNPQNPSGKIWDKDTLKRLGELCGRYHVTVVSDEIHCDLTEPGKEYVPFASASDICKNISITCISASKAFNLAGMQSAAVMIPNENLRHKVWRALNTDEVAEPNAFAVVSTVAAFENGGMWLDELRIYIAKNRKIVEAYLAKHLSELHLIKGDATYLLWIDARDVNEQLSSKAVKCAEKSSVVLSLADLIRKETGLYLSDGKEYGADGFLRMNIACPKSLLYDGLDRLEKGIRKIAYAGSEDAKA